MVNPISNLYNYPEWVLILMGHSLNKIVFLGGLFLGVCVCFLLLLLFNQYYMCHYMYVRKFYLPYEQIKRLTS